MAYYIEVWEPSGPSLFPLDGQRLTLGRAESNDVPIKGDRSVSILHAALERYGPGWCVKDLGSRNGTSVNGERIWGERVLRPGDELKIGKTRIVYRSGEPTFGISRTQAAQPPPELTRRERDVLVALCSPVLSGDVFTEPASIAQVAKALVVTEAAVKQHLAHLYDKFGIHDRDERRRVRLANEAIHRGAVSVADLRGKR